MRKKSISVIVTEPYLNGISKLLSKGVYYNRPELLRDGIRMVFQAHGIREFFELEEKT